MGLDESPCKSFTFFVLLWNRHGLLAIISSCSADDNLKTINKKSDATIKAHLDIVDVQMMVLRNCKNGKEKFN